MPLDAPPVRCKCRSLLGRRSVFQVAVAQLRNCQHILVRLFGLRRVLAMRDKSEYLARALARLVRGPRRTMRADSHAPRWRVAACSQPVFTDIGLPATATDLQPEALQVTIPEKIVTVPRRSSVHD